MSSGARAFAPLLIVVFLAGGVGALLYYTTRKPPQVTPPLMVDVPPETKTPEAKTTEVTPPPDEVKPAEIAPEKRTPVACYLTRKGAVSYQATQRFAPQVVPTQSVPGWIDIDEAYARQSKSLPPQLALVEQASETLADVLGESMRTLTSYKAYLDPADGRIVAYDLAVTAGGIPQRMQGYLTKNGVMVTAFRGGLKTESKEIDFPANAMIMPMELEFIHHSFAESKNGQVTVGVQTFFVPEVANFVSLVVTPSGRETLAFRGSNRECARYDVRIETGKVAEGAYAAQQLWFDAKEGTLLKRLDYEEGVAVAEMPTTERVEATALGSLQSLVVRPPKDFPNANPFPYVLEKDYVYRIKSRDVTIGSARVRFSRRNADASGPAGYEATASLEMNTGNGTRGEVAETRFDERFQPVGYRLEGEEAGDAHADYKLRTQFSQGRLRVNQSRRLSPLSKEPEPKPKPDTPEEHPAAAPQSPWQEPLRLVSLSDGDEEDPVVWKLRHQDADTDRPLSPGTFLYDFNRVEQLAMVVFRLPIPPAPPEGEEAAKQIAVAYQRAAFFSVRRAAGGLVTFALRPEMRARPKVDDPELEQELEQEDVPLTLASARGAPLFGQMLLDPKGRLMEWTDKSSGTDLVFTLDDPIMRKRESNERKLRGQEGPTLIRPPWY
ncbi:MAG: hypothetical protein KIS92_14330 [Planctomycetota bacterium]|nr:hypothetical protein [Planctomycetota bacterium]